MSGLAHLAPLGADGERHAWGAAAERRAGNPFMAVPTLTDLLSLVGKIMRKYDSARLSGPQL